MQVPEDQAGSGQEPASPTSPSRSRPSALPKLSRSPKTSSSQDEGPIDASMVIERVKSQTREGKFTDLVEGQGSPKVTGSPAGSPIEKEVSDDLEMGNEEPKLPLGKAGSPDKTESPSFLPRPLSPKTEPMAILSSLSYLKTKEGEVGGTEPPKPHHTHHVPSSPLKRPLETLPEIDISATAQELSEDLTFDAFYGSPGSPEKAPRLEKGLFPVSGGADEGAGGSEDEDSSPEVDLHIEESPVREQEQKEQGE